MITQEFKTCQLLSESTYCFASPFLHIWSHPDSQFLCSLPPVLPPTQLFGHLHVHHQILNLFAFVYNKKLLLGSAQSNICTWREDIFFVHFVPSLPEIMPERLELSVWGRPACVSRFSLLNNSACLFTCSLLTLKLQPPVTLLLNTLMIMTSALPLALPSCVKYWESFVNVCVSVSCCVCKTESEWLRLLILRVCER